MEGTVAGETDAEGFRHVFVCLSVKQWETGKWNNMFRPVELKTTHTLV